MKYVVARSKDGTVWQTTGLNAFKQDPGLQHQGLHKLYIVAEAESWDQARSMMGRLREEDYQRHMKWKRALHIALSILISFGLLFVLMWLV